MRGATQDAQALLLEVMRKPVGRDRAGLAGPCWYVQLHCHIFLRHASYGAILRDQDDVKTSI
jgi:hypothetical protein